MLSSISSLAESRWSFRADCLLALGEVTFDGSFFEIAFLGGLVEPIVNIPPVHAAARATDLLLQTVSRQIVEICVLIHARYYSAFAEAMSTGLSRRSPNAASKASIKISRLRGGAPPVSPEASEIREEAAVINGSVGKNSDEK